MRFSMGVFAHRRRYDVGKTRLMPHSGFPGNLNEEGGEVLGKWRPVLYVTFITRERRLI
jgi:hypothetical protein